MQLGIIYAVIVFIFWGLVPLYFRTMQSVPPLEIMLQRVLWAFAMLLVVQVVRGNWRWLADLRRRPKVLAGFSASALLLSFNWYVYVWAVNNGQVLETSLGYFIAPLINMLLGFLVLRERLRPGQWVAVAFATAAVAWMTAQAGSFPWIGLSLAGTFGIYGLLRKTAALGTLEGLTLETLLLFPIALAYLAYLTATKQTVYPEANTATRLLLAGGGPATVFPLLLFAAAARRIPLTMLGVLQYIGPTISFLLGVLLFDEAISNARLIGFAITWAALVVYTAEGIWHARRSARAVAPTQPEY